MDRILALLVAACFGLPAAAAAQRAEPRPAQVLVLGTYHFAAPGLDVARYEVADVLTPQKQREIQAVVDAIARFRPDRIAIEALPSTGESFDSLYSAFRAGRHSLERDERQQIGFRLADRLGHERLFPIDHEGSFPFGPVMDYAQQHDPAFIDWFREMIAANEAVEDSLQRTATVGEILLHDNDPARIEADRGNYIHAARVGAGDGYAGADFLAAWYERNIRIFANIQRLAEPGTRVLVIFGEGHAGILRELIEAAPRLELVEAVDYLSGL